MYSWALAGCEKRILELQSSSYVIHSWSVEESLLAVWIFNTQSIAIEI